MEEWLGIPIRPTPEQRRFMEGGRREIRLGQRGGCTRGVEILVIAQAANEEEARLCLEDLRTKGFCLQSSDGRRVEPSRGGAKIERIKFDEEKRTSPCPDCDGAGCEHCGGTGQRRQ